MQNNLAVYELYAIRYARRDANRSEHFIGGDPHDGPMPMDYFVWLARCGDHNVVIDTGFANQSQHAADENFYIARLTYWRRLVWQQMR